MKPFRTNYTPVNADGPVRNTTAFQNAFGIKLTLGSRASVLECASPLALSNARNVYEQMKTSARTGSA